MPLRSLLRPLPALAALVLLALPAAAQNFDTRARAAYVYDMTTDTVLLSKNADDQVPPASMSKLMTLFMAFEAIAKGTLTKDEELPVSQHAASYGGSSMFLRAGERVKVEDLLQGVIVLSGNDAAAVLAEGLGGSEAEFAEQMNVRAQQLGMENSHFVNSNGWPEPDHYMSMHDLVILSTHIIRDFPTFYALFAEEEYAFDNRVPANSQNRNPLLGLGIGADGLKTGHTQEAGYGLVGSAKRDDRRIVFALSGMASENERAEEGERIVNWAFRQFVREQVTKAGTRIAEAEVWMGSEDTVGLTVDEDLSLLVPVLDQDVLEGEVVYDGPIEAPIAKGDKIAELVITRDGLPETRLPLVAESDVARGGFGQRLKTAALVLLEKVAPQANLDALPVSFGDA